MPLMPAPPMPTKCTAPSSSSDGTGSDQAATSCGAHRPATASTMSASRSSASGTPAAAACAA